jgi:hypothetical protein
MKALNLAGMRFGRWTVLESASPMPYGKERIEFTAWKCKCDCGTVRVVSTCNINSGRSNSCGCLKAERIKALTGEKHHCSIRPFESLYHCLLSTNRHRRIPVIVELTYEQFLAFTRFSECHYCHGTISWTKYGLGRSGSSAYNLDRKDNTLPYSVENCVPCCWRCNNGKSDAFTYAEWFGMTAYFRKREFALPVNFSLASKTDLV